MHDLSQVAPTSMVLVPCVDGISHNEIEDATQEWIEAGANVLLHGHARARAGTGFVRLLVFLVRYRPNYYIRIPDEFVCHLKP